MKGNLNKCYKGFYFFYDPIIEYLIIRHGVRAYRKPNQLLFARGKNLKQMLFLVLIMVIKQVTLMMIIIS